MIRSICRTGIVLAIGLLAAGCSGTGFTLPSKPADALLHGPDITSSFASVGRPEDAAPVTKLGSAESGSMAIARLAERRGQNDQARSLYQDLLGKSPNDPVLFHRLGVVEAREGRFEQADENLQKSLALKPDDPAVLCDLGYSYYLQQRLEEAESVLDKARKIKPNDISIRNNLALVYGEQERYSECMSMFGATGDDAQAYANLAFVYTQHGQLEKAKEMYSRALTIDSRLRPAAEAMVQLARTEDHIRDLARIASDPTNASPRGGDPGSDDSVVAAHLPLPSEVPQDSRVDQASFSTDRAGPFLRTDPDSSAVPRLNSTTISGDSWRSK